MIFCGGILATAFYRIAAARDGIPAACFHCAAVCFHYTVAARRIDAAQGIILSARRTASAYLISLYRLADLLRGDLAVEVGNAAVPALQKRMIKRARELRRFSITATQMMESMITNPVPTRAEVSDVANAVLDGTDAVMCSAETAVGAYPFETVRQMSLICAAAEKEQDTLVGVDEHAVSHSGEITHAVASAAVHVAKQVRAKAIVALTESGSSAFHVSRYGILIPIYALTPSEKAQRRMAMYRGVRPLKLTTSKDHETAFTEVEALLRERGVFQAGEQYVITSGRRMRETGSTNSLEVRTVRE